MSSLCPSFATGSARFSASEKTRKGVNEARHDCVYVCVLFLSVSVHGPELRSNFCENKAPACFHLPVSKAATKTTTETSLILARAEVYPRECERRKSSQLSSSPQWQERAAAALAERSRGAPQIEGEEWAGGAWEEGSGLC